MTADVRVLRSLLLGLAPEFPGADYPRGFEADAALFQPLHEAVATLTSAGLRVVGHGAFRPRPLYSPFAAASAIRAVVLAPSSASRMMSAWPLWCAISRKMCSSTRRIVHWIGWGGDHG